MYRSQKVHFSLLRTILRSGWFRRTLDVIKTCCSRVLRFSYIRARNLPVPLTWLKCAGTICHIFCRVLMLFMAWCWRVSHYGQFINLYSKNVFVVVISLLTKIIVLSKRLFEIIIPYGRSRKKSLYIFLKQYSSFCGLL